MVIKDAKQINDIQKEFNAKFPFLKLEFYKTQHGVGEGTPDKEKLNAQKTIGEVRNIHNTGDLSINENMTVITLEQELYNTYGLNAQVFRKSGNLWLQTTSTDDWTLKVQNEKGGASTLAN